MQSMDNQNNSSGNMRSGGAAGTNIGYWYVFPRNEFKDPGQGRSSGSGTLLRLKSGVSVILSRKSNNH